MSLLLRSFALRKGRASIVKTKIEVDIKEPVHCFNKSSLPLPKISL
jgi:hypothetical protein